MRIGIDLGGTKTEVIAPVSYTHLDVYKRQCLFWKTGLLREILLHPAVLAA